MQSIKCSRADWARIEEIFLAAADLTGDDRARFLEDACAADSTLRREVESLLASDGKAESAVGGAVANTARAFSIGDPTHAGPYKLVREIGRGAGFTKEFRSLRRRERHVLQRLGGRGNRSVAQVRIRAQGT